MIGIWKRHLGCGLLGLLLLTAPVAAQKAPSGKQPKAKSNKEVAAFNAVVQANDPDVRIAAADNFYTSFADSELRGLALQLATEAASTKRDFEQTVIYAERTLEVDPKNYVAMYLQALAIAQKVNKLDLDKNEQLAKAVKLATEALPLIASAEKPQAQLPDAAWEESKADYLSNTRQALGVAYGKQGKYDEAAKEFKAAVDAARDKSLPNARWAHTANEAKKYDDALAAANAVLSDSNALDAVKQFAEQERKLAAAGKTLAK